MAGLFRVLAVVKKEVKEIWRDPITLGIALVLPLVMLFLFGYAITLDVKDIPLGEYDLDRNQESRDYIAGYLNSGYFKLDHFARDFREIDTLLNRGRVRVFLVIPSDFSRKLASGRPAEVQTLVDGSFSNTALVAINYAKAINSIYSSKVSIRYRAKRGLIPSQPPPIKLKARVWYNSELRSVNYIVPGLFAVILMAFPPLLPALAVVREKEGGSIQQIFTSLVRPYEFIAGKMVPYGAIAFLEMLIILVAGVYWFRIPFRGNLGLLLLASLLYVFCTVGIGLLVSTLNKSQVVAMLLAIVVTLMPSFLFSGFLFPIAGMPYFFQFYTYIFPARYFNEVSRGIVLKGIGLDYLWLNLSIITLYAFAVFSLASTRFKKKLG